MILILPSCQKHKEVNIENDFDKHFYSEIGACPFEGCMYGEWTSNEKISVYKKPKSKSSIVGEIPPKSKFNTINGKIEIVPGIAYKVKALPTIGYLEIDTIDFYYKEPIYVLHYVGEGFSKVYHKQEFKFLEFPASPDIYKKHKSNFDWLRIEKYPTNFKWWVKIEYEDLIGWILVDENVNPADRFG
jgi:hypothetical protein